MCAKPGHVLHISLRNRRVWWRHSWLSRPVSFIYVLKWSSPSPGSFSSRSPVAFAASAVSSHQCLNVHNIFQIGSEKVWKGLKLSQRPQNSPSLWGFLWVKQFSSALTLTLIIEGVIYNGGVWIFCTFPLSAQCSQSVCRTTGLQPRLVTLRRGTRVKLPNMLVNSEFLAEGATFSHHTPQNVQWLTMSAHLWSRHTSDPENEQA